jgi:lipopolysaccharide/colanic/teichoic acid biosynthesis glycosyltransferase
MNPADRRCQPALLDHFASFATPWGRRRHQLYLGWKRLSWRWLVGSTLVLKRGLDIVASFCALVLLSPLFTLIALLIKLEDRGPILFPQIRVGRHGREFRMFKFRSMRVDAEARLKELLAKNQHEHGITFKIKNDPRITVIGRWLRKFSFDELPQFYNVLIGDMSLVGPRPPVPREVAKYTLADRRRLAVTPGITCIWQISGRAEIDFPGQVQLDVRYIESRSFSQDVKILLKTIPAVLSGTGAY